LKPAHLILSTLTGALLGFILAGWFYNRNIDLGNEVIELQKQRIEQLKIREDSITNAIKVTRDSLETVFIVLENAKRDAENAARETSKLRKRYENITFKPLLTDSARYNALKNLYPNEGF